MTGRRAAAALGVALAAAWLLWPAGDQPGVGSLLVAVLLLVLPVTIVQMRKIVRQPVPMTGRPRRRWLLWAAVCLAGAVLLVRELAEDVDVHLFISGDTSLLLGGTRSLMGYLVLVGWSVEALLAVVLVVLAGVLRDVRPPGWTRSLPLLPLALTVALLGPGLVLGLIQGEKRYGGGLIISQPMPNTGATQARVTTAVLLLLPPVLAGAAAVLRRVRPGST